MARKPILILIFMFLAGVALILIFVFLGRDTYPLTEEHIPIQGTDFTIQIVAGYEYFGHDPLIITKNIVDSRILPRFYISPLEFKSESTESPVDIQIQQLLLAYFDEEYQSPKKKNINGIDVYISRYVGPPSSNVIAAQAIILYKDQGFLFHAWGPSSESVSYYDMLDAMLSSLQINTGK